MCERAAGRRAGLRASWSRVRRGRERVAQRPGQRPDGGGWGGGGRFEEVWGDSSNGSLVFASLHGLRGRRALRGVRARPGPGRGYIKGGGEGAAGGGQAGMPKMAAWRSSPCGSGRRWAWRRRRAWARGKDLALGAAGRARPWKAVPPAPAPQPGRSQPRFPFPCPSLLGGSALSFLSVSEHVAGTFSDV